MISPMKLGGMLAIKTHQLPVVIDKMVNIISDAAPMEIPNLILEGFKGSAIFILIDKIMPVIPQLAMCIVIMIPRTIPVFSSIPNMSKVNKI